MMFAPHKAMEHAATVTYAGGATTLVFFGLHASDIAMLLSALASLIGMGLQIYVAITKIRLVHRSKRWDIEHRHDGSKE